VCVCVISDWHNCGSAWFGGYYKRRKQSK